MITARLKLYALIAAVFIAAAIGIRWRGARDAITRMRAQQLDEYQATRRRMDNATPLDLDADDARRRLRERTERARDL